MYKLDKNSPYAMTAVDPETGRELVIDASAEGLLTLFEEAVNNKVKGDSIVARMLRGTVHISFYFLESSIRRRRFLRGETNPEERRFKLK